MTDRARYRLSGATVAAVVTALLLVAGIIFSAGSRLSALESAQTETSRRQDRTDKAIEDINRGISDLDKHLSRMEGKLEGK